MFEGDYAELAPLRPAAELLASRRWPALYDLDKLTDIEVGAATGGTAIHGQPLRPY
jgi:hypothetical protein